jgi:hypothetical protein
VSLAKLIDGAAAVPSVALTVVATVEPEALNAVHVLFVPLQYSTVPLL